MNDLIPGLGEILKGIMIARHLEMTDHSIRFFLIKLLNFSCLSASEVSLPRLLLVAQIWP